MLSLYVVILLDALLAVVQQLRKYSHEHASVTTLTRVPDLIATCTVIASIFGMPLNPPLEVAIERDGLAEAARPRSPEDTNTVWGAMSYSWMSTLMHTARNCALRPMDVWALSLNNRAAVLSHRFKMLK